MDSPSLHELKLTMTLVKGEDALTDRVIPFESASDSVQVGRASKTERKQLIPAKDNMWISNPVISRYHAKLYAEHDTQVNLADAALENTGHTDKVQTPLVFIEDSGSSHGTYVNDVDIREQGKKQIKTGDRVQFGSKVLRGSDEFEPPVYRVKVDASPRRLAQWPTTAGRSISVPEESDESEMDESDSEVGSTDSHSSPAHWDEERGEKANPPPGSIENPFTIDDRPAEVPVIIEIASREASEEYEPSPNVPLVPDTYADVPIEMDQPGTEDGDDTYDGQAYELENESPSSPVYIPTSPAYEGFVPPHSVQLPPMEEIAHLPLLQPLSSPFNSYRDGPFAQPSEVYGDMVSIHDLHASTTAFEFAEHGQTFAISDDSQTQEHLRYMPHIFPVPAQSGLHATHSVTVSTQDLLRTARDTAGKNDMSINSIINPTTAVGTKRKADEISEDEQASDEECIVESRDKANQIGGVHYATNDEAAPSEEEREKLIEVVEVSAPLSTAATNKRPTKRLRSSFASHLGAFAFGGVAVLAGLMSLPDNYFG